MPVGVTPIEIEPASHLADPDRAAHEISPDDWHASVGVATTNCPYCNEETIMNRNEGGSDGNGREGGSGGNER